MSELGPIIEASIEQVFAEGLERAASDMESGVWPARLWERIEASGFSRLLAEDQESGWREALPVLRAAGRRSVPAPVAETIVSGWLLARAGMAQPDGPLAFAVWEGRLDVPEIVLKRVPWARQAAYLVLVTTQPDLQISLFERASYFCVAGRNMAGEPRDLVRLPDALAGETGKWTCGRLSVHALGALIRAAQIAGALERVAELSTTYANDRLQFGKPIGKFQAIQQQLAVLSTNVIMASTAVEYAFLQAGESLGEVEAAIAKICAGEAGGVCCDIAHAVHGAMGFTREYPLQLATRRIMSWREEFGSESFWSQRLGERVCAGGPEGMWRLITEQFAATA